MIRHGATAVLMTLALSCARPNDNPAGPEPVKSVANQPVANQPVANQPVANKPEPGPTFHAVVTSEEWLGLHPLLSGELMISAGPKLLRVDAAGEIHADRALLAGIELPWPMLNKGDGPEMQVEAINDKSGWWTLQVGGTWPGATFLTLELPGDHEETTQVYRWAGDRWSRVKIRSGTYSAYPRQIQAWKDQSLLAWREFFSPTLDTEDECSNCPPAVFESAKYKAAERDVARAKQLAVVAGPAKGPALAGQNITAFAALTSGEVFVALEGGSLLVLAATGEQTTVAATGATAGTLGGLVARAPNDVVGFGSGAAGPLLVRHDGHGLTTLTPPACAMGLASLSIVGATWWATCASPAPRSYAAMSFEESAGSLWRKQGGAGWEQVKLAEGLQARLVVARAEDDVWVAARGEDGKGTVLHSRAHGAPIALGGMLEIVRDGFFAATVPSRGEAEPTPPR